MTTPDVTDTATWLPTVTDVISDALFNVGAIDENQLGNVPGPMYRSAFFKLNGMVKAWITTGIHVWTEEEALLFLQPGQFRYLLGGTTLDHSCDANQFAYNQLAVNGNAGATSITLQNATAFLSGQNIGVVLDTGFTFWTTLSGAPSGDIVPLSAPLPSNASSPNFVYTYPLGGEIIRPLQVPRSRTLQWNGFIINPMTVLSRQEYFDLSNPTSPGVPTQWFYNPGRDQGDINFYNPPQGASYAARFTWYRPIYDFNNPANTPDFPVEWSNALTWNLARELEPGYGVPLATSAKIEKLALQYLEAALEWDRESQPVQFGMDYAAGGGGYDDGF
jgi:hypothetical protein